MAVGSRYCQWSTSESSYDLWFVTRKKTSKCKYSLELLVHFWTNDKLSRKLGESLTLILFAARFQFVPTAALLGFLSSRAWPSSPPFSMPFFFSSKDSITSSTSPPHALISRPSSSWPASFCCTKFSRFFASSSSSTTRMETISPASSSSTSAPVVRKYTQSQIPRTEIRKTGKMIIFFIPGAFYHSPSTKNL